MLRAYPALIFTQGMKRTSTHQGGGESFHIFFSWFHVWVTFCQTSLFLFSPSLFTIVHAAWCLLLMISSLHCSQCSLIHCGEKHVWLLFNSISLSLFLWLACTHTHTHTHTHHFFFLSVLVKEGKERKREKKLVNRFRPIYTTISRSSSSEFLVALSSSSIDVVQTSKHIVSHYTLGI